MPILRNLVSAEQASEYLNGRLSAERLVDLARTGVAPCYWLDGQDAPLFGKSAIAAWVDEHLLHMQEGGALLRIVGTPAELLIGPGVDRCPSEIASLYDLLREVPIRPSQSGVYFLTAGDRVVYVGQTTCIASRIADHIGGHKTFDRCLFLPVPRRDLNDVEGAFIRALRPPLNLGAPPRLCNHPTDDAAMRAAIGSDHV